MDEEDLPPRWLSLIERLWEADGKSIVDFLPEIVATIKSTKSARTAERGLFTVLHSPKVQHGMLELEGPTIVIPVYQAAKDYADAAMNPYGKPRENAFAKFKEASKGKALTMDDAVRFFEGFEKETNEASAERAKRARRKLGVARRPGRPKKTGQE